MIVLKSLTVREMAVSTGTPWVVTNNVHYARADKRIIHDVLTCLKHEVTLANAGRRLKANGSYYLKSPEEMAALWQEDFSNPPDHIFEIFAIFNGLNQGSLQ